MMEDLRWDDRTSYIMSEAFLDFAMLYSLPMEAPWNIRLTMYFKNEKFVMYMRLLAEEDEPRVYAADGSYTFLEEVFEDVKSNIVLGTPCIWVQ